MGWFSFLRIGKLEQFYLELGDEVWKSPQILIISSIDSSKF